VATLVQVRLLGAFEVRVDGQLMDAQKWTLKHARCLWQMLCLAPGHRLPKEEVIEALWPEARSASAAANRLYHTLHALRALLAAAGVATAEPAVALVAGVLRLHEGVELQVDATAFHQAAWRARQAPAGSAEASQALRQAAALATGALAVGVASDDWFAARRQTLLREQAWVLEQWITQQQQPHDHDANELLAALQRLLNVEPCNEWAHRQVMDLHAAAGRQDLALQQYTACSRSLRRELGVEPTQATQASAKHIAQSAVAQASPLASTKSTPALRHLPRTGEKLLGRQRELAQLRHWLVHEGARLVTVLAGSGIGKTRLALAAAHELAADFDGQVMWVSLGPLARASAFAEHVCLTLGLSMDQVSADASFCTAVGQRRALLVLDRLEHLPSASNTIAHWLNQLPGLQVLVTSQLPAHLREERLLHLPPLLEQDPAAAEELLVQTAVRAGALQSEAEIRHAAMRLCQLAEGNALAIELAGAALVRMGTQQLARELHQHPLQTLVQGPAACTDEPQHTSLLRAIQWSASLLDESSRELLAMLTVFAQPFSAEAAQQVLACVLQGDDVLLRLAPLLHLQLVARQEGDPGTCAQRFYLLDSVREFAVAEASKSSRLAQVKSAHAHYFSQVLWGLVKQTRAGQLREAQDLYRQVRQELEVLMKWAVAHGSRLQILTLADSAGIQYTYEGRTDKPELLRAALRIVPQSAEEIQRSARCYYTAAFLHRDDPGGPEGLRLARRAWHLASQSDDTVVKRYTGVLLALICGMDHRFWPAIRLLRRLPDGHTSLDQARSSSFTTLSGLYNSVGEYQLAQISVDRALEIAQSTKNLSITVWSLVMQCRAERELGRLDLAERTITDCGLIQGALREGHSEFFIRQARVLLARDAGNFSLALQLLPALTSVSPSIRRHERNARTLSLLIEAEAGLAAAAERLRASVNEDSSFGGIDGDVFFATHPFVIGLNAAQGDWPAVLKVMAVLSHVIKQGGNARWAADLNDAAVRVAHWAGESSLAQALFELSPRLLQAVGAQPTPHRYNQWASIKELLQQRRSELLRPRASQPSKAPATVLRSLSDWRTAAETLLNARAGASTSRPPEVKPKLAPAPKRQLVGADVD
jgi:DNA-binding SARP family transcriptional activator/predicted ATPase